MPTTVLKLGKLLYETLTEASYLRICRTRFAASEPGFYAGASSRFDAPDKTFETLYCARNFKTCFLETLVRDNSALTIRKEEYEARSLSTLILDTAKLRLVSLYGDGAQSAGLNLAILATDDYSVTQSLSKKIYQHPDRPDGIVYRSRFDDNALAIVLYGRARRHVKLFPNTAPEKLTNLPEMANAVRAKIPFIII